MTTLKLIKGAGWTNGRVAATRADPYIEVEDEKAGLYIATGFFVAANRPDPEPEPEPEPPKGKPLKAMNLGELEACARWYKISCRGCKTKADYVEALREQLGSGPVTYGDSNARALTENID